MIIVVSDACLIFDIIDINLFDEFFKLNFQAHITSSVLAEFEGEEYLNPVMEKIKNGSLKLHHLSPSDQIHLKKLMKKHSSRLSEPDCSCLYIAPILSATILTCEKRLTATAKNLDIEVHGSLWVFDLLIESSIITRKIAYKKLKQLMLINPRMPKKECEERLERWKK